MGDSACKFLSRARWWRLHQLWLCRVVYVDGNETGEKGYVRLSKAAWGELEMIGLGKCSLTQTKIKLAIGVAGTSAGEASW